MRVSNASLGPVGQGSEATGFVGKGQFLAAVSFPSTELCPRGVLKTSITYKLQVAPQKMPCCRPTEPLQGNLFNRQKVGRLPEEGTLVQDSGSAFTSSPERFFWCHCVTGEATCPFHVQCPFPRQTSTLLKPRAVTGSVYFDPCEGSKGLSLSRCSALRTEQESSPRALGTQEVRGEKVTAGICPDKVRGQIGLAPIEVRVTALLLGA
jgi:hypothetical protein